MDKTGYIASAQIESQKPGKNENHITEGKGMLSSLAGKLPMCSELE